MKKNTSSCWVNGASKRTNGNYEKYDANPISVGGCLPLLIQMPFLTGLFFTLTNPLYSAGIIDSTYLGVFNLGTRSYVLPIIAFLVYAIQTKLTMAINPP